jgi:hypothetical protein
MDTRPHLAPALERSGQIVHFRALDRAIEGDPRHCLGIGEVLAPAAHLPDAFVGFMPDLLDVLENFELQIPGGLLDPEAALPRLMQRVHHFTVHVELKLVVRGVADAHRLRLLVTVEPRHLPFGEPPLAAHAIHDLQLMRTAGHSA